MVDQIFPNPRIFKDLHSLIRKDFKAEYLAAQKKDMGLENSVVELLKKYAHKYDFNVHLTNMNPLKGFSGLVHKFDAGIKDRFDFRQCVFEVKYRREPGMLHHEDIMKFHHATLEYFLKLLREQGRDEADLFRCFVTNQEVSVHFRRFFYSWGIALVDPKFIPVPMIVNVFEDFQRIEGTTTHMLGLIKQASELIDRAYFSLGQLVPPHQKHGSVLDLGKLNPADDSEKILAEHKSLQDEITALQKKHKIGKYR